MKRSVIAPLPRKSTPGFAHRTDGLAYAALPVSVIASCQPANRSE
jgi:hypothetical protein